ncbi:MAG: metallophosphoesterase family protein [Planctomycetota bacterium]
MSASPRRVGVIADVHANLEALQAVLAHFEREKVDEVLCCGDIVGYNADPEACLKLVRERCRAVIRGNHDRYATGERIENVRESVHDASIWTSRTLPEADLAYLRGLSDLRLHDDRFLIVHGSPRDRDEYILTREAILDNLTLLRQRFLGISVCFFGHSHLPMVIGAGMVRVGFTTSTTVPIEKFTTYLINPGSVGQPRDRCPLASCGIFDAGEMTFRVERISYDVEATRKKIFDAGLDPSFAERLKYGI